MASTFYNGGPDAGDRLHHAYTSTCVKVLSLLTDCKYCICSSLTRVYLFYRTSGHVERFADLMVKDLKNGQCFRADHLLEAHLEKLMDSKKTTEENKARISLIMKQVGK